ncbi:MAG: Re/Si-specific NAD(P)(+) transhydrogenase subunit alpha [Rhodobacteraceae bacterium]|nr:Re/Si-specific NAD(P)(+) transhydrogenase subunit alpha [Paracoccaceae bacterium]
MKIAVPKETRANETRVAIVPETIKKFAKLGADITVERLAGESAQIPDDAFSTAGAGMASDFAETVSGADVVLKIQAPTEAEVAALPRGAKLFCTMSPFRETEVLAACARAGVEAFAMEFMPRITRAQSMDVLSSQSNLGGYRAVLEGAAVYGRAMPMMMTAAGTVAPAKVFIMGVGVAGLQAIATARRLGAIVTATDVRAATEEQVKSLGAEFIAVKNDEFLNAQTEGGYAKEMSDDYKRQQAELVANHIAKQDIVITTALIPGRPAPKLITAEMVASMKPGAVIVDMAAEQGGNCALTQPDQTIQSGGVTIVGKINLAGALAADSSSLYARNLFNFVSTMISDGALAVDYADELVEGTLLTRGGQVVHPRVKELAPDLAAPDPAPAPEPAPAAAES